MKKNFMCICSNVKTCYKTLPSLLSKHNSNLFLPHFVKKHFFLFFWKLRQDIRIDVHVF